MNQLERIVIDPKIRSGQPCIKGTRLTVRDILEYMAGGDSRTEILNNFPQLQADDINACLAFAARREDILFNPAA